MPPSTVLMLLAKLKTVSEYASLYCSPISMCDAVAVVFHVDRLVVQHLLAAIEMLDELRDAAVVLELGVLGLAGLRIGGALVGQRDQQSLVQEREFAQALRQRVVVIFGRGEDRAVGQEVDFGSALPLATPVFFSLLVGSPLE